MEWVWGREWDAFWTGVGMVGAGMMLLALALARWRNGRNQ